MSESTLRQPLQFTFAHNNFNVIDLAKSLAFYQEALGLVETGRKETEHFTLVYLGDGQTGHALELTWLRDWGKPEYDLGDSGRRDFLTTGQAGPQSELVSQFWGAPLTFEQA